jgi:LacI family transcriptional regulator
MPKSDENSQILAVILPEEAYWCREVLPGVTAYLRRHTDLFLENLESLDTLERRMDRGLRPVGLIGVVRSPSHPAVRRLQEMGGPIVNISARLRTEAIPTVTHDNLAIGEMAAGHLLDRGFRHFAFVSVGDDALSQERYAGFADRLQREGIPLSEVNRQDLAGDPSRFREWLDQKKFPLGLFAAHDRCARKLCSEAERMGFRIPDDLGILGVDNDPYQCELTRTPLSSIDLQFAQLGKCAAALLHKTLLKEDPAPLPRVIAPRQVVQRRSTDYLAVGDDLVRRALTEIRSSANRFPGVGMLAATLGVSRSTLEKHFKAATGKTVFEEIHTARMEQARMLLRETNLSVMEISHQIGIADNKRFARLFKENSGMTPRAFRRQP